MHISGKRHKINTKFEIILLDSILFMVLLGCSH